MHLKTIRQLNLINQDFYKKVALSFSETRSQAWEGWSQLLPNLEKYSSLSQPKILDVGCGNGRFANFLASEGQSQWEYLGLDNSGSLLGIAQEKLTNTKLTKVELQKLDLVEALLNDSSLVLSKSEYDLFDVVVAFGVLHHIPSHELRQKFFQMTSDLLKPDGTIIVSLWNFIDVPKLLTRAVSPEYLKVKAEELDENDYFLTWQKDQSAVRFCHYLDQDEVASILQKSHLQLVSNFQADGKNHHLNDYLILKREKN